MTITPDEIVLFRIAERLGLSLIVLLVALVAVIQLSGDRLARALNKR